MASYTRETRTIYIPLLCEGTRVSRPTQGIHVVEDQYTVLATPDYDPEDEVWKFPPGSLVKCELETHQGEKHLVAKELVR